ncbi:MAG TPA: dienelactone hydrolase family protein [Mucilaginibacter sp.]|nr:dienelactone hydrolase family protein [Mucilaginibacter sp.]
MYTHHKDIVTAGIPVAEAKKALIMLHGRGATATGIVALLRHFHLKDTAVFAPQALHNSWYPYSFLAPVENNEPALSSALALVDDLVNDIVQQGISKENIYFFGFSQGACLTLEYIARNAGRYGGAIAFTGGLIGQQLALQNYKDDFLNTPVLVTTGDPDPHVPLSRVEESVEILRKLNADVILRVFKGKPHTVTAEEIALAEQYILK